MFRFSLEIFFPALVLAASAAQLFAQPAFPNIGRVATPAEIKAWDIDVRPDFKGLPAGKGSVAKGQEVWETKCESCHGTFGESGEVFTPIAGGISAQAIATGRVETLIDGKTPIRSTMMKVATVSTLWDYINRAMPWNAPKSLSIEEVYASVAYILHLNDIVPADFTLSNDNIADIQKRMPNRNGMSIAHGLSGLHGTPDVKAVACMRDCLSKPPVVTSRIPDYAKDAHGNLAAQMRALGVRGVRTGPATSTLDEIADAQRRFNKNNCNACHAASQKTVGPSIVDIRAKYATTADAARLLAYKIKVGGQGVWGAIPMPAQTQLSEADLQTLAKWLATLQ